MKHSIIFVGLDVRKDSITVALADDGRDGEVRLYGSMGGETGALDKAIRRFRRANTELRFVYEAGPCGYELYRHQHLRVRSTFLPLASFYVIELWPVPCA